MYISLFILFNVKGFKYFILWLKDDHLSKDINVMKLDKDLFVIIF